MEPPNNPTLERLRQFCCRESFVVVSLLVIAVAFNLFRLLPSFLVDVTDGTDVVLHTLLAEAVVDAVKDGRNFTDPWQGTMGMGHPVLHYYQHLPHIMVALLHFLTLGTASAADVLHWSTYVLVSIFPLSIYWSARKFGFDGLISAAGALVASVIATNALSGFAYSSYVVGVQGLYTQVWAMVLLPIALAVGYQVLHEGRGYFWAVLLLAATLMSHILYGYMAFITLGVLVFVTSLNFNLSFQASGQSGSRSQRRRSRRSRASNSSSQESTSADTPSLAAILLTRVKRLLVLFLLVVAVTSYFLVPFFLDLRYFNSSGLIDPILYDSHGASVVIKGLFQGDLFDFDRFPSLTILVLAGLVVCLSRWRQPIYLVPVVIFAPWLLLFFGRPTWGSLTNLLPLSGDILMFRFIGGVHLGGILLIGVVLGAAWRWSVSRTNMLYPAAAATAALVLLLPVFVERSSYLGENADSAKGCRGLEAAEEQDVYALLEELQTLPEGRVYTGKYHYELGNWGLEYLAGCTFLQTMALNQGLDTMSSLYHRYSLTSDVLDGFDESRWEHYNLFNVRYVIAPEGQPFPEFVNLRDRFGQHRLYEVETTGYFDLVGSELAFAGEKDDFLPAAASWLSSRLPNAKRHPAISIDKTSSGFPVSFDQAPDAIAQAERSPVEDRGTVLSEESGSNFYSGEVSVGQENVLLLKASYHPNWRATVDGRDADTLMLMPGFVGVELSPGEHQVLLEYKPRPLRAVLLVLGLLLLPAIAVAEWKREVIATWFRQRVPGRSSAG
ncbi:MAG: YfhO family protein [SAR202 cluster bacterium]|nr:YfhO family protein [SAR202 cluster bacterium]